MIRIYTDGACSPNPGRGGWACILTYQGHEREISGSVEQTTNNQMELMAVIRGLQALKGEGHEVEVFTDSQYVQKGATSWIAGWKRKGWKTKTGAAVLNKSLWQQLDALRQRHVVTVTWVRGHNGHPLNERVDRLAVAARCQPTADVLML